MLRECSFIVGGRVGQNLRSTKINGGMEGVYEYTANQGGSRKKFKIY